MMALMVIAATAMAPAMVQQIKRDREEEMIHRGTEYARAIKKFYKKFGRYPTTLEQLDNTNQIRFLRKRYKDPLTKDGKWTLLHYGDVAALLNTGGPGVPAGALGSQGQQTFGVAVAQQQVTPGFGASGAGQIVVQNSPSSQPGGTGTDQSQMQSQGNAGFGSGSGQSSQSGFGGASGPFTQGGAQVNSPSNGTFTLGSNNSNPGGTVGNTPGANSGSGANPAGGNQTFGAGAIVGVSSASKDKTIRTYNKKKTYNEWQFIYTPLMDRVNALLRGPYSPTTFGNTNIGTPAGQLNQNGQQQQSPFGQQNSSFGQQQGAFGNQQPQAPAQQNNPPAQFPPDQNH